MLENYTITRNRQAPHRARPPAGSTLGGVRWNDGGRTGARRGDEVFMNQTERAGTPTAAIATIAGGAVLAVASFLPWAQVSGQGESVIAAGIDGSDGYLTLAAGILAALSGVLMLLRGPRKILA